MRALAFQRQLFTCRSQPKYIQSPIKQVKSMATHPSQLITLSTLKFIEPADLASSLREQQQPSTPTNNNNNKIAIIDVRDNDHMGGHIKSSQWVPINQLDARMPEIVRVNKDKERVVFHCMLSQQRGPKSALAYARARAERVKKEQGEKAHGKSGGEEEGEEEVVVDGDGKIGGQQVCVLEGGFENWQRFYAEDETLTEGYVKDLWE